MGVKGGFGKMNTLPQGRFSFRGGKLCNGTVSRIIVCTVLKQKDGVLDHSSWTHTLVSMQFTAQKHLGDRGYVAMNTTVEQTKIPMVTRSFL